MEPEDKDKILQDAYARLQTYTGEGKTLEGSCAELKYWLEQQAGVTKVDVRGRSTVTVHFEDNSQIGILVDSMSRYGGSFSRRPIVSRVQRPGFIDASMRATGNWSLPANNAPGSRNALVFDPLYSDWPPESTTDGIEQVLKIAGYTVDLVVDDAASLTRLATIDDGNYGVIFMRSHGGVLVVNGDDKIHVMTRPLFDLPPDPAGSGFLGVGVFYINTNWGKKYTFAFNDEFVRHHLGSARFPATVMHLLVCHGADPLGSDDLIDAFLGFGVGCYTGWTRNASLTHGDPAAVAFFTFLCSAVNRSVTSAVANIASLGHTPDNETGAELVAYGDPSMVLRPLPKIVVPLRQKDIAILRRHPTVPVELVLQATAGETGWPPLSARLMPADAHGYRRLVASGDTEVGATDPEEEPQPVG